MRAESSSRIRSGWICAAALVGLCTLSEGPAAGAPNPDGEPAMPVAVELLNANTGLRTKIVDAVGVDGKWVRIRYSVENRAWDTAARHLWIIVAAPNPDGEPAITTGIVATPITVGGYAKFDVDLLLTDPEFSLAEADLRFGVVGWASPSGKSKCDAAYDAKTSCRRLLTEATPFIVEAEPIVPAWISQISRADGVVGSSPPWWDPFPGCWWREVVDIRVLCEQEQAPGPPSYQIGQITISVRHYFDFVHPATGNSCRVYLGTDGDWFREVHGSAGPYFRDRNQDGRPDGVPGDPIYSANDMERICASSDPLQLDLYVSREVPLPCDYYGDIDPSECL